MIASGIGPFRYADAERKSPVDQEKALEERLDVPIDHATGHLDGDVVKREVSTPEGTPPKELQRIKAQEEKLRREKIVLLRRELAKAREAVRLLEHELRALGDPEATKSAGRINWEGLYDQLPVNFSTNDVAERTGARAGHIASVMYRWREEGRLITTGRGKYRKMSPGGAGTRK